MEQDSYVVLLKNINPDPECFDSLNYSVTEIRFKEVDNDDCECFRICRSWLDQPSNDRTILSLIVCGRENLFLHVLKFSVHNFLFYVFYKKIIKEKEKIIEYSEELEKCERLQDATRDGKIREGKIRDELMDSITALLKKVGNLKTRINYNYTLISRVHFCNMDRYAKKLPESVCSGNSEDIIASVSDFIEICREVKLGECELWVKTANILYDRTRNIMDIITTRTNYRVHDDMRKLLAETKVLQEETKKLTEVSTNLLHHSNVMSTAGMIISFFIVFAYTISIWKSLLPRNFENAGIFKIVIPLFVGLDVLVFMQITKHILVKRDRTPLKSWKNVLVERWKEVIIFTVLTATVILYFRHHLAKFLFSL